MDQILEGLSDKMSLTKSESQKVIIPVEVWNTSAIDNELCLVGRVLSRKSINLEAFECTMFNGWNLVRSAKIQKLGEDIILVRFDHVVDKNRVLDKGP